MMRTPARCLAGIGLIFVSIACSGGASQRSPDRPVVIATTSILGNVVANLGGDGIELITMIPAGVDPHDFAPSAQQVAAISSADLIVANGLALEEGLVDLLEQAQSEGIEVVYLANDVDPLPFAEDSGSGEGGLDPHFWQDPLRMRRAVEVVGLRLVTIDVPEAAARSSAYQAQLDATNARIESILAPISLERRLLVTNHDAFGYFADRYGFTVIGTVIPGGSTLAGPSSADLAALVMVIEENRVPAIFVENTTSPSLAESLAGEIGHPVEVVQLVSDALGEPGSATGTYLDLLTFNADAIGDALGG